LQPESISVHINGETRQVPSGQSVAALLDWLEVVSERVAIELNKSIVRKRDWDTTTVANGAQVEIVEFVGGG
jgi:thiamine biosynthesis protein ThiS